MRIFKRLLLSIVLLVCLALGAQWILTNQNIVLPVQLPTRVASVLPQPPLTRPYGMAPAAFDGFMRACYRAKVQPRRIGQTIGDHPRSVGYHKVDGRVKVQGKWVDYGAAVDIGTQDLERAQINRLLEELARQGFAAFYREGPKWEGGEHIHAIYAPLKMKPQLRAQLREWARKRRREKKRVYNWQKRLNLD